MLSARYGTISQETEIEKNILNFFIQTLGGRWLSTM